MAVVDLIIGGDNIYASTIGAFCGTSSVHFVFLSINPSQCKSEKCFCMSCRVSRSNCFNKRFNVCEYLEPALILRGFRVVILQKNANSLNNQIKQTKCFERSLITKTTYHTNQTQPTCCGHCKEKNRLGFYF